MNKTRIKIKTGSSESEINLTANTFIEALKPFQSAKDRLSAQRYFKTGKGEYAEGDQFMGVRNGPVKLLAKKFVEIPLSEIEKLLDSPIHEIRSGGLGIMDIQARRKKTTEERRKELFDLYLKHHPAINNWDLVDKAAPSVVGGYLFDKSRDILLQLAHSENIWERRTAMIATLYFIRQGEVDFTCLLAGILLHDKHDLIHKATGWMLRCVGEKDKDKLRDFLEKHAATMPRTMLRYAIEKFDMHDRQYFMEMKKRIK